MEDYIVVALAVIVLLTMLIAIIFIIIFACTRSKRNYNRIKNLSEAEGTITNIETESHNSPYYYGPLQWYIISYNFTDINGKIHEKKFQRNKLNELKKGYKFTVYYDADNPDKCVTDYTLKADKNLWWKALIIAAIMIIVPFILAFTVLNK